jgi:hypothetical protein
LILLNSSKINAAQNSKTEQACLASLGENLPEKGFTTPAAFFGGILQRATQLPVRPFSLATGQVWQGGKLNKN